VPVPLINFPLSAIVDGILSYLQFVFGKPEVTPAEYRWHSDDRQSLIRISGTFVIDNQKPMSAPFIVVERGSFQAPQVFIDNLKSGDPNSDNNYRYVQLFDGTINIIIGSGVAGEASSIANFIALNMQADRHGIMAETMFIRNMYILGVGPEVPVVKDSEVRRWEVTVTVFCSLQMSWLKADMQPLTVWTKAGIKAVDPDYTFSAHGELTLGSDRLVDSTKDFGIYTTNDPQLLEQELTKGWYYIQFVLDQYQFTYTIDSIVDHHTLKLLSHDSHDDPIPFSAIASATNVSYKLLWNNVHIHANIPRRS
jgi:hypothetical protein